MFFFSFSFFILYTAHHFYEHGGKKSKAQKPCRIPLLVFFPRVYMPPLQHQQKIEDKVKMRKGLVLCIINTHMMKNFENFLSSRVLDSLSFSQFLHRRCRRRGRCHSLLSDGEFVKRVVDNPLERTKGGMRLVGGMALFQNIHLYVFIYFSVQTFHFRSLCT